MKLSFLGPGLLYAGAAVGVSHLVQSTRAGAMYGFDLVLAVLVVNLLKYPFFEIGTRYTIATEKTLQEGYRDMGRWALWSFLGITVGTMFIIVAVVTLVTAGLVHNLTGIHLPIWVWSGIVLGSGLVLLAVGRYRALDSLIKVVVLLLTISTLVSLAMAVWGYGEYGVSGGYGGMVGHGVHGGHTDQGVPSLPQFDFGKKSDILFLVALLGWMPIPVEAAVWQSDWTMESRKNHGGRLPAMRWALLDFRIGYWGTTILALCFLSLGALVMHGSGQEFSSNAVQFSDQLVQLISKNLGIWAYPFIAMAASLTMVSTTITCMDAYPRVVTKCIQTLYPNRAWNSAKSYFVLLGTVSMGALGILIFLTESMRTMVDFATSVSFLTAPLLAFIHYRISQSPEVQMVYPVSLGLRILSLGGLAFLTSFALYYLYLLLN